MQKDIFIQSVESQLVKFYENLKTTGRSNDIEKARIEGYMLAGVHMGIVENSDLKKLISDVHWAVFGKSIEERRMDKALCHQSEKDWEIYDTPTYQR